MNEITAIISLKETSQQIERNILVGIRDELNSRFPAAVDAVKIIVQQQLFKYIQAQPEWDSILNGQLRGELGLVDGQDRLYEILNIWLDSIEVTFHRFRVGSRNLTGGIVIEAIVSSYEDVINTNSAILVTEKGELLPWLRWLLLEGTNIVIADYHVVFGNLGRTGDASMRIGGNWSVPAGFAGIMSNNFVTRAIASAIPEMETELEQIIERLF